MLLLDIMELIKNKAENNLIMATLLQMGSSYQDIFEALSDNNRELYFGDQRYFILMMIKQKM